MSEINFCMQCRKAHGIGVWFKTTDHYLDSEYANFAEKCKKQGFRVKKENNKEIRLSKDGKKYLVYRHECGPEIISLVADSLGIIAGLYTLAKIFKHLTEKKAKKNKEKPTYAVYIFNGDNKVQINDLSKKELTRRLRKPTEKDFAEMKKEAEAWQLASIDALIKFENNN